MDGYKKVLQPFQRSFSESSFDKMETDEEIKQILDKMSMDHACDILDESLSNVLEDFDTNPNSNFERQIPLAQMFNSDSSGYQPKYKSTNRKRRRTEETAAFNLAFEGIHLFMFFTM